MMRIDVYIDDKLVSQWEQLRPKPVVKDVTMEIVVNGTRTETTWTFVDGQMTPVAAVEVLK